MSFLGVWTYDHSTRGDSTRLICVSYARSQGLRASERDLALRPELPQSLEMGGLILKVAITV